MRMKPLAIRYNSNTNVPMKEIKLVHLISPLVQLLASTAVTASLNMAFTLFVLQTVKYAGTMT